MNAYVKLFGPLSPAAAEAIRKMFAETQPGFLDKVPGPWRKA